MDTKPVEPARAPAPKLGTIVAPTMSDNSICLRRFDEDDVPELYAAACESLGELSASMTWCHPGYSVEDSRAFVRTSGRQWEDREHFSFAICDAEDGTFLGSAGLSHMNAVHKFANLGYWVRTSHAGRGIATAATRLLARWAFAELKLRRLEIVVAANNKPSQRVAEKAGARREGVLRQRLILGGQQLDAILYALVPLDFES